MAFHPFQFGLFLLVYYLPPFFLCLYAFHARYAEQGFKASGSYLSAHAYGGIIQWWEIPCTL